MIYLIFTVPTTCSRPSIEMVGFMYLFITVPTTCSRPSIEMVGFIYLFIYLFLRRRCPGHTFGYIFFYVGLLGLSNVHLRIRFLI